MNIKKQLWFRRLSKTKLYLLLIHFVDSVYDRPVQLLMEDSLPLDTAQNVFLDWKTSERPFVGLVKDGDSYPYWRRYERFLRNNDFKYSYYSVHSPDWCDRAKEFDIILWRPLSNPYELEEAKRKLYVLEKHLGKRCIPSYADILLYEDKILQYELMKLHGLPAIDTVICHDYAQAYAISGELDYPVVSKIVTGSGSYGVELVRNKRACMRLINAVFSRRGRKTYWPYVRQKGYIYLQSYIKCDGYDIRIVVIGPYIVGYYRKAPSGDFRASGMGIEELRSLPMEAMQIARRTSRALNQSVLAVDMLKDTEGNYWIIELSSFIQVDTDYQLMVDGRPGIYHFANDDSYVFVPGRFWLQELTLEQFFLSL